MRKIDQAYEFIKDYIDKKDYPPTIREIANAINVKSTSTISYYLKKLEEKSKIVKGSYKNRSIQLVENLASKVTSDDFITLPYVTYMPTNGQTLTNMKKLCDKYMVSANMFKGLDMFMMPVKNNWMKKSSIIQGDMVIVSHQNVGGNGEIVVASLNNNYVIARLYKEFKYFKLEFDCEGIDPIYLERAVILGKVVGVIRNQMDY